MYVVLSCFGKLRIANRTGTRASESAAWQPECQWALVWPFKTTTVIHRHPGLRTSQLRICIMTAFQQPPCAPSTISNIFHLVLGEWHHPSVLEWWPVWALVWAFKTGHSILWHVLYMYVYFELPTDGRPAVQPAPSKPQRTSSLKDVVAI